MSKLIYVNFSSNMTYQISSHAGKWVSRAYHGNPLYLIRTCFPGLIVQREILFSVNAIPLQIMAGIFLREFRHLF
jgi:hypothetical protein